MLWGMKHKLIRNNDVHPHSGFNKWLALLITNGVGNMWFFYFLIVFIGGWMLLSKVGPLGFDPYPYALMLLIVGGIFQALAMGAIRVGQTVKTAASDARAETDHETLDVLADHDGDHRQGLKYATDDQQHQGERVGVKAEWAQLRQQHTASDEDDQAVKEPHVADAVGNQQREPLVEP